MEQKLLRSFGRIKSRKIRAGNQNLLDEVLPKVKFESLADLKQKKIWLEIGFGGGEHLSHRAQTNPDIGYVGFEPFINGAIKLLRDIKEKNLQNVRVFNDDARLVIEQLPDESVDGVYVLFPDPWPKRKHNKRRIISHKTLDMLVRVLKPGGQVIVGTDHMGYGSWILRHFLERDDFKWDAKNWYDEPEGHIKTKYQLKNMAKSAKPVFFRFTKA